MSERKAKSPYQRYQKSPYQYSETYRRWKAAQKAGRDHEARAAHAAHRQYLLSTFGPKFFNHEAA